MLFCYFFSLYLAILFKLYKHFNFKKFYIFTFLMIKANLKLKTKLNYLNLNVKFGNLIHKLNFSSGHTSGLALRDHSWSARKTIWVVWDWNHVGSLQGKHLTCCMNYCSDMKILLKFYEVQRDNRICKAFALHVAMHV